MAVGEGETVSGGRLVTRELAEWVASLRYEDLPADVAVQWCRPVPDAFHARNGARSRRYVYVLLESPVRPAIEAGQRALMCDAPPTW